jgi:hypothetical protein
MVMLCVNIIYLDLDKKQKFESFAPTLYEFTINSIYLFGSLVKLKAKKLQNRK